MTKKKMTTKSPRLNDFKEEKERRVRKLLRRKSLFLSLKTK